MLMCYLRVCPFTKPIGQDCTVEKRADQCCPIVTCPDGKLSYFNRNVFLTTKQTFINRIYFTIQSQTNSLNFIRVTLYCNMIYNNEYGVSNYFNNDTFMRNQYTKFN